MRTYTLYLFACCMLFAACNNQGPQPEPGPQPTPIPSVWTVNTNHFTAYNVFVNHGSTAISLTASLDSSSFDLAFHLPYLPQQGSYPVDCSSTNGSMTCLEIGYLGFRYKAGSNVLITADSADGKAIYALNPSLFYNELNAHDSIVVSGTFREP